MKQLISGEGILIDERTLTPPAELTEINYVGLTALEKPPRSERTKITLAEDEYFVLGDNTKHSYDSRFWGPVTREQIFGKLEDP